MDTLALGLSLGLGAGLAPGPLLVLVVRATLTRGFAAGARVAAAPLITDAPIVALCTLVLRELPETALAGLSLAGAAFVAWLARDALRPAAEQEGGDADLRRAAVANVLSPHPWLFWITVGGPILVGAGSESAGLAVAFLAGFYATLIGAKVALAAAVDAGRRRGGARLVPRAVAGRVLALPAVARLGGVRIVSAALLAAAAVALLVDALGRLSG